MSPSLRLPEQDVHVELDHRPHREAGVGAQQGLLENCIIIFLSSPYKGHLHDLKAQGVVPQPDALPVLPCVRVGRPGVHVSV